MEATLRAAWPLCFWSPLQRARAREAHVACRARAGEACARSERHRAHSEHCHSAPADYMQTHAHSCTHTHAPQDGLHTNEAHYSSGALEANDETPLFTSENESCDMSRKRSSPRECERASRSSSGSILQSMRSGAYDHRAVQLSRQNPRTTSASPITATPKLRSHGVHGSATVFSSSEKVQPYGAAASGSSSTSMSAVTRADISRRSALRLRSPPAGT